MNQPEAPPSTGLIAGKYQLVKLIGRGGMGSVWEARHVSLGTPSAIKFIEAEYANSHEARSRFDKEAKAAATIQSKHAIQIYDHGVTDDGKPYIVMELLTGEPLDKRIERLGALQLQDTARILQQVCRGLARAHDRGIIHRDLKPENIFLVRHLDDDEEVAKVLDFGIAKIQSNASNPGISSSTKTGAVLGTPFFMSPEQARGLRNVDHRTDIWSLGVIAFKCVTGRLPFDGESVGDLLVKICTAPIPVPSQLVPGLPPAFDAWFSRALERDPERRFATATELAEHLAFTAGISLRGPHSASAPPVISGGATPSPGYASGGATPAPRGTIPSDANAVPMTSPHPGMMTAAPLTSSTSMGDSSGPSRAKWFVGAALAGILVAATGAGIVVTMKKRGPVVTSAAVKPNEATRPTPSIASATTTTTTVTAPTGEPLGATPPLRTAILDAPPTGDPATPPSGAAVAQPTTKPTSARPSGARPGSAAKPPAGTAANHGSPPPLPPPQVTTVAATAATAATTAPPAPTPPAPTAPKKPNKNDPGY